MAETLALYDFEFQMMHPQDSLNKLFATFYILDALLSFITYVLLFNDMCNGPWELWGESKEGMQITGCPMAN